MAQSETRDQQIKLKARNQRFVMLNPQAQNQADLVPVKCS